MDSFYNNHNNIVSMAFVLYGLIVLLLDTFIPKRKFRELNMSVFIIVAIIFLIYMNSVL